MMSGVNEPAVESERHEINEVHVTFEPRQRALVVCYVWHCERPSLVSCSRRKKIRSTLRTRFGPCKSEAFVS